MSLKLNLGDINVTLKIRGHYTDKNKRADSFDSLKNYGSCCIAVFDNCNFSHQFADFFDDRIQLCDDLVVKENLTAVFALPTGDVLDNDHTFL